MYTRGKEKKKTQSVEKDSPNHGSNVGDLLKNKAETATFAI
jgi:hypothetical protein